MSDERDGERFWQVQKVLFCEKHGGDGFAYTTGLASRGLHELHMWSRPTHGDDPGADFSLSGADLADILNRLAHEWVTGRLRAGDVREIRLDDGLTTAVITCGQAVDAGSLEAWGARPSLVTPLAWSLHRPPRGEPVEIMDDARHAYEQEIRVVAARCDKRVAVSGALLPDGAVDFGVGQPYGPLSALVSVHARAVAGTPDVDLLVSSAYAAEAVRSPGALMGLMATLSRLSGRDEQLEAVHQLGHRVIDRLAKRRAWRNEVAATAQAGHLSLTQARRSQEDVVGASVLCLLMSLALDDVLPEPMVLAAQGPWRATMSATGADPGQRWRCSEEVEQAVRRVFADLDGFDLSRLVRVMMGPVRELLGDDLVVIEGLALTTAVAPPPVTSLVLTRWMSLASSPLVCQQLSTLAQLMTTVMGGAFTLDDDRMAELESILRFPLDAWEVA